MSKLSFVSVVSVCVAAAITLAIPAAMSADGGPLPTTGSSTGIDPQSLVGFSDTGISGIEVDYAFPQPDGSRGGNDYGYGA